MVERGENGSERAGAMRLAYVVSRFPKIRETFVLTEVLELQRRGVPVEVFPLLREREAVRHPEADELVRRAHYQPLLSFSIIASNLRALRRSPRRYVSTWWDVLRGTRASLNFFLGALVYFPKAVHFALEMRRLGVTHVHAHFANHPALVALVVRRIVGIPFSFTAHGSDLHKRQVFLAQKVREASFVVTISEYNRDFIVRHTAQDLRSRIHVVHCGVDVDLFRSEPRPRRDRLHVICVGALEEVKGHAYLVEALARLGEHGVPFHCALVGDGPLRGSLETRVASLGLADRVTFLGNLPRAEVAARVGAADVLVLASVPTASGQREGIPVVLMEGMAAGLPVVSSRMSGIPELVIEGETGLLAAPRDTVALCEALEALALDPERRERMGRAGRERVAAAFEIGETTARKARLFLELAGAGRPAPAVGGAVAGAGR